MDKNSIRIQIKEQKRKLSKDEIAYFSDACIKRLFTLDCLQESNVICPYVSYNQEVYTWDFIKQLLKGNKKVALPKVCGEEMDFYYIRQFSDLVPGAYGILEPDTKEIMKEEKALLIMPGLAFDEEKNRIGYGGGFYDRYLAKHPHLFKIALAYEFQIYRKLEVETFDIKPDLIVTEKRIIG